MLRPVPSFGLRVSFEFGFQISRFPAMPLKLISTDFDGTLVPAWDAPQRFCDELVALLTDVRRRGIIWAVNTGRSPGLLEEAWGSVGVEFHPDYALTSERDV